MVDDVLNKYGVRIITELREAIKNKPLPRRNGKSYVANASGSLERSLKYVVSDGTLRIYGNRYIGALVHGRKPTSGGSRPGKLKDIIRKWIDDKGINPIGISKDSLAFLITRQIHKEGTLLYPQGSDLVEAVVSDGLINDLKSDLVADMLSDSLGKFKFLKRAA